MLLRLAVMTGLITGTAVAKYYAAVGSGDSPAPASLEDFLVSEGVEASRIDALKRAYAETTDFGTMLILQLRTRHADESRIRAVARALNACETAQLMAIRKGKPAKPIGEMMIELGHVSKLDVEHIIQAQAMLKRVDSYQAEVRARNSLAGKLGLLDSSGQLDRKRLAIAASALVGLILAIVLNAVFLSGDGRDEVADPTTPASIPRDDLGAHAKVIRQHYGNLLSELRLRNTANAEHYRNKITGHFRFLENAKLQLKEPDIVHISEIVPKLNFAKLSAVEPADLAKMSDAELEAALK